MQNKFILSLIGRPGTIRSQNSLFSKWIESRLPEDEGKIDINFVNELAREWLNAGLQPGTVKSLLSVMKKYAEYRNIQINVKPIIQKIMRLKEQPELAVWTFEECEKALSTAYDVDRELYYMMMFAVYTGARRGEMFGLRWKDVDFLKGQITIHCSYNGPTKNGRARLIPISEPLERVLMDLYVVGQKEDILCFKTCDPNNRLKRICRRAGIPEVNWHSLRHFFATSALEAGKSPRVVASILGHRSVRTVLDIYWDLKKENLDFDFLPRGS